MAITGINLRNFKSFEDTGFVPLRPFTVIFGRNNSGKSSLLHSLLILRQTVESADYGPRLNLRGPLHPAGSFADLVHQHQSRLQIGIEVSLRLEDGVEATVGLDFASDEPRSPRLTHLRVATPKALPLEIRRGRGQGGPYELWIGDQRKGREGRTNFTFATNQVLPFISARDFLGASKVKESSAEIESRGVARTALLELSRSLSTIRAVGAFRQQPSRRYEYDGRPAEGVDAVGQRVVDALFDDSTRRRNRGELLRSVNRWLRAVGRVKLMPIRRIAKVARIFELRLKDTDSGRWANFADVGFGIGQALPVLVEGLRTPPGGVFIVQEPEIHLHPDAQLAMADFLISLVATGRHVIVETHSEAILLRTRKRVLPEKRKKSPFAPDSVSVLYVGKDQLGSSTVEKLEVDRLGQIKNWPAGFLDEMTDERMSLLERMADAIEEG